MTARRLLGVVTVLALTVVLLSINPGVGRSATPLPSPSSGVTPAHTPAPASASIAEKVAAELAARHVPMRDVFLPNFNAHVPIVNHQISPLYARAPAPMGLGDFGIQSINGTNVGTVSYTSSVEGILTVDNLNSTYLDGQGPDAVSIQLNTVATNVQLFDTPGYQFWIQNVPEYIPHLGQLSLLDNVWNFSSGAFNFTQNSIYSSRGFVIAPVYYYAIGPTFHVAPPFTIRVYNNATIVGYRSAVFLNYSLTTSNGVTVSGSYDRVVFNSSVVAHPKVSAVPPTFQIDGQQYGANGYLPNDAELMLGGSDDGDTTSITAAEATMQLLYLPNGTAAYRSVPAAYDFGTDTGETTEGMAVWSSGGAVPTAHLGPGPSFLEPIWGVQGAQFGHINQSLTVTPANAFVFVSKGRLFRDATAQWAPVPLSGGATYALPNGNYSYEVLLSEYTPVTFTLGGTGARTVTLASNPALGVYTPLVAWDNAQLAAISNPGGAGTVGNPYVLFNAPGTIDPVFGQMNDFLFPVFPGILLTFTSDFVTISNAPSFFVQYSLPGQAALLAADGLPSFNYLQLEFQNVTHMSLVDTPVIAGWFSASDGGMSLGSLLLWNSSHDLIANDQFDDMGVSVYVAFGGENVFWGNTFAMSVPPCAYPYGLLNYPDPVGIQLSGNHDLTYNNIFDVPFGAVTPTYAPASFLPASYHDAWNVTRQPATDVRHMNGFALSGSILGLSYEGGNFWETYGTASDPYGHLPFTDAGQITNGGDDLPLLPFALHAVRFTETGLPAGTHWTVTVNGVREGSNGASILFWEPSGTYAFTVGAVSGFTASPTVGGFSVTSAKVAVAITWS